MGRLWQRIGGLLGAMALLCHSSGSLAQSSSRRVADDAGVRQAGKDYLAAVQRRDVKAIADFWTADGTFTDETGRTFKVRERLAESTTAGGASYPHTAIRNIAIRFLTDDVALEDGDCETASAGGAPVTGRYTALWVRENGRWKLDTVRATRAAPPADGSEQLASLDVFAGQWSGEIDKSTVRVSAKWDANKRFLRREFTIASGNASLAGTQEIGWDPLSGRIKSWSFLDDGSYGEGLWSLEGNAWMIASTRVLPDGSISTSTQIYKFPDKNTMIWKSIHGSVDGQPTDDFEITLKRSQAAK